VTQEIPQIDLNDGRQIPQLGFGVFQIPPEETANAVRKALEVGYRHIDTAQMYGNEAEVGQGIRDAGIARKRVFITSKLDNGHHEPDDARRAFEQTLTDLDTEYVDLFLIHWPLPTRYDGDFVSTWKVFEEFRSNGHAKSIGVSNFQVDHLERLAEETETVPAVNQIEIHPYHQNRSVKAWGESHGIVTEAWSPIAQGAVLDDPAIGGIAARHDRSPAQVTLRWHVQKGNVIFPKSTHADRIRDNFEIFDFELSEEEMTTIDGLEQGEQGRTGPHPDSFDRV
jgi:2,5-diketo-D-gluconate reductase A